MLNFDCVWYSIRWLSLVQSGLWSLVNLLIPLRVSLMRSKVIQGELKKTYRWGASPSWIVCVCVGVENLDRSNIIYIYIYIFGWSVCERWKSTTQKEMNKKIRRIKENWSQRVRIILSIAISILYDAYYVWCVAGCSTFYFMFHGVLSDSTPTPIHQMAWPGHPSTQPPPPPVFHKYIRLKYNIVYYPHTHI
jgi:hypothetical protein